MNEEQKNFIKSKIEEGWSYAKISQELNIDRRKIASWCSNNNCKSKKAKTVSNKLTDEQKERFIYMYTNIEYGAYRYTYNDMLNEFTNIKSRGTIQNIANSLGLRREEKYMLKNKALTYEQRKYIVESNNDKTIDIIAKELQMNERTIADFLKSQNIRPNRLNPKYKKDIMLENKEFKKEYENLLLSPTYLSNKWDIDNKTISIWRKEDYGDYTHRVNGALARTRPEQEFEDILFELEIPYFYQWQIDNWRIDYYLGKKICIEINGIYWHNKEQIIDKDVRKNNDLKDKGYTVINFTEYEIYNEKDKVTQILKNLPF